MRAKITSKGQVTIPQKIRHKLDLKPGHVLDFDENATFLKAIKAFDPQDMYSVIGCCAGAEPDLSTEEWLEQTRGSVEIPDDENANGN